MIFSCRPLKIHVVVKVQNQIVIHNIIIIIITGTPVATSNSAIIYDPPVDIKMTHFTKHQLKRDEWFSPSFYTHNGGYCMCIRVDANGFSHGENTHVSVYAHLKPGANDNNLQWPFRGSVDISLLDQRSAHHINETIPFADGHRDDVTSRVVSGTVAKSGPGYDIIAHTDLQYNKLSGTEYLTNDTLHFRINQVATFSYHTVSKLPSWYISSSTSLAKFTMTDFSKHKAIGDDWYSSPFYTHPQGYKFCVAVDANGWSDGAGTHVSVGVSMRKGEHDDRLEFPFRGTFHIKILNWRQDSNHAQGTVSITDNNDSDHGTGGRVTTGRYAPYIQSNDTFLPHTSLYYDATNNTEYVNDNDCLLILVIKVDIHNN